MSRAAEPVLFAGFVISNSEVGDGAWSITPRIVAEICGNGLQITADVTRAVHLGSRQDEGVVRYSADTMDKELALITARARDAVATFLSPDYLIGEDHRAGAHRRGAGHPPGPDRPAGRQGRQVQRRDRRCDPRRISSAAAS